MVARTATALTVIGMSVSGLSVSASAATGRGMSGTAHVLTVAGTGIVTGSGSGLIGTASVSVSRPPGEHAAWCTAYCPALRFGGVQELVLHIP